MNGGRDSWQRGTNTVLVVDPDPRTAQLLSDLLQEGPWSMQVVGVSSAAQAVQQLQMWAPSALIVELVLQDGDGLSLITQARTIHRNLPVLALTANPSTQSAVRAFRLGVDDYLNKHRDTVATLPNALRRALNKHVRDVEITRLLSEMAALNDDFLEAMERMEFAYQRLGERLVNPDAGPEWRLLLVDDDPQILMVLRSLLASQPDYQLFEAGSLAQARALLEQHTFDVVLTDKNLGDGNGLALMHEISQRFPETRMLMMTAFASVDSATEAMRYGAVDYLQKPFADLQDTLDRIRRQIEELTLERDEARYMHIFLEKNSEFIDRYRLLKNKLLSLQAQP